MKHKEFILSILLLGLMVDTCLADNRFYPANNIRCTNVSEIETDEYDPINRKYKVKRTYYHYYTGNDTIVDGKPCVMLWKYCADTPKEKELRFLCEEDGLISYKYPLVDGSYSDWTVLFEFPTGGWIEGEKYIDGWYKGELDHYKAYLTTCTLLNGEEVQIFCLMLMYGIGYNDWPFFEHRDFSNGPNTEMQPYNFYRNDTLLWGESATYGPYFPAYSIRCTNMVTSKFCNDTTFYNLYTGGDTIVDGRECVQLWQYCTDTPEKLVQHLLHEENDKVYIKYSTSEDDEWKLLYDFSLPIWHVGDSIEHGEYGRLPIESIDTITLLNGKIRQVASSWGDGWLIHGMGYVGEPFFTPINHLGTDDVTESHSVNFYCYDQQLWGKEIPQKRERRFFPANGIYSTIQRIRTKHHHDEDIIEVECPDTIFYNIWTGNDTIVDGRECVTVWHNEQGKTTLKGVVYEDNTGFVFINHLQGENPEWEFLYDFTPRRWKDGDFIRTDALGLENKYDIIFSPSSIMLCNGEYVPYIYLHGEFVYGIGYLNVPVLTHSEVADSYAWYYNLFNFYRNGELLWGEEYNPNTSGILSKINNPNTTCYDLQGRPVANPTRGIYIKNGKKVLFSSPI